MGSEQGEVCNVASESTHHQMDLSLLLDCPDQVVAWDDGDPEDFHAGIEDDDQLQRETPFVHINNLCYHQSCVHTPCIVKSTSR